MTQSERERLEAILKKLKESGKQDLSTKTQINAIENELNKKR
jgi:hypothetical protein